jgi:hypothetical protein
MIQHNNLMFEIGLRSSRQNSSDKQKVTEDNYNKLADFRLGM